MKDEQGYADRVWDALCLLIGGLVFLFINVCVCFAFFSVLKKAGLGRHAWFIAGSLYTCTVAGFGLIFFTWADRKLEGGTMDE
jgi:hypothetical protein